MRIWKLSHGRITHFAGGLRERLWGRRVLSIGEPTNWGRTAGRQSDSFRQIGRGNLVVLSHPVRSGSAPVRLCAATGRVRQSAEFSQWLEMKYRPIAEARVNSQYTAEKYNWTPNSNSTCWEVPQAEWPALERLILRRYFNLTVEEALEKAYRAVAVSPPDDPVAESREGRRKLALHWRRERNGTVAYEAKARALREGRLRCEVCGFDFAAFYGPIGREFIEAHHKTPLARLDPDKGGITKLSDISLLCANCHRMVLT